MFALLGFRAFHEPPLLCCCHLLFSQTGRPASLQKKGFTTFRFLSTAPFSNWAPPGPGHYLQMEKVSDRLLVPTPAEPGPATYFGVPVGFWTFLSILLTQALSSLPLDNFWTWYVQLLHIWLCLAHAPSIIPCLSLSKENSWVWKNMEDRTFQAPCIFSSTGHFSSLSLLLLEKGKTFYFLLEHWY